MHVMMWIPSKMVVKPKWSFFKIFVPFVIQLHVFKNVCSWKSAVKYNDTMKNEMWAWSVWEKWGWDHRRIWRSIIESLRMVFTYCPIWLWCSFIVTVWLWFITIHVICQKIHPYFLLQIILWILSFWGVIKNHLNAYILY